jgi:hypothetical protein
MTQAFLVVLLPRAAQKNLTQSRKGAKGRLRGQNNRRKGGFDSGLRLGAAP